MEKFNLTSEDVDKELKIDDSSVARLSEELRNFARKESKYTRLAAQTVKQASEIVLEMNIYLAKAIRQEEEKLGYPLNASARQEFRKVGIFGDEGYQKLNQKLIDATETADILNGLVRSWTSRGYRLQELCRLADRVLKDPLRVYESLEVRSERVERELEKDI